MFLDFGYMHLHTTAKFGVWTKARRGDKTQKNTVYRPTYVGFQCKPNWKIMLRQSNMWTPKLLQLTFRCRSKFKTLLTQEIHQRKTCHV